MDRTVTPGSREPPVRTGIRAFVDWYLDYYRDGGPRDPKVVNLG